MNYTSCRLVSAFNFSRSFLIILMLLISSCYESKTVAQDKVQICSDSSCTSLAISTMIKGNEDLSLLNTALDTAGFILSDIAIPKDKLNCSSLHPLVSECMDSPIESIGRIEIFSEKLLSSSSPESALQTILEAIYHDSELETFHETFLESLNSSFKILNSVPQENFAAPLIEDEENLTLLEEHYAAPKVRRENRRLGEKAFSVNIARLLKSALKILHENNYHFSIPISCLRDLPIGIKGNIKSAIRTEIGWIVIGGEDENEYPPGLAVIIDKGGNDIYTDPANADSGVSIVIDFGGDDLYRGKIASSKRGIAILIDYNGNDLYEGTEFTEAFSDGGIALLWDESGNDTYSGNIAGEAFAVAGVSLLFDKSGDDEYRIGSFGQAVAGPNGTAILCDVSGNDRYVALGGSSDVIRDPSQRLSFSQGFSTGLRPGSAGGFAMLADGAGNDMYQASLFAEGCGYWGAVGALTDFSGDDIYLAHQYAEGSGVHLAVGYLIDENGCDQYQSFSVSQGCGHDIAAGILFDKSGNDLYRADNLSQAAGNANGFGFLFDEDGDDNYLLDGKSQGQGYGVYEAETRRYGSIGILLDSRGRDNYSMKGKDSSIWIQGDGGVGIDR